MEDSEMEVSFFDVEGVKFLKRNCVCVSYVALVWLSALPRLFLYHLFLFGAGNLGLRT